jgi:uncharacterized membrane protein YfcA
MLSDPWFYAVAVPAMIILGLSKGGFGALGLLVVPIMSLVISPVQAAGITLPILVLSDLVALYSYRGQYDARTLWLMLPAAVLGVGIGWLTAAWVTEHHVRLIVGVLSAAFAIEYFLRGRHRLESRPQRPWVGRLWGMVSGFTSFVSHAGGPPFQVYVAPLRLPPIIFAGTSVIFFAAVNGMKLIPYFFLGQLDWSNLHVALILLPISIPATFLGVWLVRRFDPKRFYNLIYFLILLVGLDLAWAGLRSLI